MKVYQIIRTEATKNYTECIFLETLDGIYLEHPGNGFYKHPRFTRNTLKDHLEKMQNEGFIVKESTFTARA